MTEQMTPGTPGPPGPSPRDLAARSAHHPTVRAEGSPRPSETPVPAPAPAAEPQTPRVQVTSAGKVRATGAQALVYALERVGADVVFGIPGGAVLPAYDPLLDSEAIRHILVRH